MESKTIKPERGDYLTPAGEPTQAPRRWLGSPETHARLGMDGETVEGGDSVALMEGQHPASFGRDGRSRWGRRDGDRRAGCAAQAPLRDET
jgi:hypothetical protein